MEYILKGDTLLIVMDRDLDHHNAAIIKEEIDGFIYSGQAKNVVFDFEQTGFMDSSGIGIILGRYKKITLFGGKVFVVHADKQIKRILLVSGMSKIVQIME